MGQGRVGLLWLVLSGCGSEHDLGTKLTGDTGDTSPPVDTGTPPCPDYQAIECTPDVCIEGFFVDMGIIYDCFRDPATNGWIPDTPDEVTGPTGCQFGVDEDPASPGLQCLIEFYTHVTEPNNLCECEDACTTEVGPMEWVDSDGSGSHTYRDPSGCCEWNFEQYPAAATNVEAALKAEMDAACQVEEHPFEGTSYICVNKDDEGNLFEGHPNGESVWGGECPTSAIIGSPNSDYSFVADFTSSFVLIDTGTQSLYSSLVGSSAVETSPSAFLRGVFWASDTSFWGWQFTDWMFFFENPIEMDVNSGTFRVLPAEANYPGITARGYVAGNLQSFQLALGDRALGMFNPTAGTWSLTYYEASGEGSVQVYLAGSIHDPPQ